MGSLGAIFADSQGPEQAGYLRDHSRGVTSNGETLAPA